MGGSQLTEPEDIKLAILDHFKNLFARVDKDRPKLRCSNMAKLSRGEAMALEAGFSEEEIWETTMSCDGNKSLGPDGFNFNFLKRFWDTINGDIL